MISDELRYWAFVSYSHEDRKWGEWLLKTIETFSVPEDLVGSEGEFGEIPSKIFPLFRDRDELPVAADLGEKITDALTHSRFLIVICSPASAKSRWVNKEIATFKAMDRGHRVLSLIVGGEPGVSDEPTRAKDECFPPALRYEVDANAELTRVPAEPLAADARDDGDGKRDASLKIIAGMLGVSFDAVKRRDAERRIRRLRITIASLVLLAALVSGLAYYANDRRIVADEQALVALSRQLASKAQYLEGTEPAGLRAGVLLASQSIRRHRTFEADALLRKGIRILPTPVEHFEHAELASPLALDAAQNYVAAGMIDGTARVWDVREFDELIVVQMRSRLTRVAVSADGKYLVTGDRDGVARVWEISTGDEIHSQECRGQVTSLAFSGSHRLLAIACERAPVVIVNVGDWSEHARMTDPDGRQAPLALAFGTESRLAAVTSNGGLQVWDTTSGDELKHIPGDFPGSMCCNAIIAYSEGGRYLAGKLIPEGNILRVWDTETWELAATLRHDADLQAISFSWFTDFFATGDTDGTIQVWDPHRWRLVSRMKHGAEITHLEFDRQRKQLVSASADKTARVWDVKSGEELVRVIHRGTVAHAGFVQASSRLASFADDGQLSIWETPGTDFDWRSAGGQALEICVAESGEEITVVFPGYAHRLAVADLSYSERTPGYLQANDAEVSEDCRFAAYVDRDRSGAEALRIFDLDRAEEALVLDNQGSIADLAFSLDNRYLAVAYEDGSEQIIDLTSGESIHSWSGGRFRTPLVTFARSGELLASAQGRTIAFRTVSDDFGIAQVIESALVTDLAAQPAGRFVAAATRDGAVLIDTQTFVYGVLSDGDVDDAAKSDSIDRVAFSSDNQRLATAGRSILVWDVHSKRPGLTIEGIAHVEFLAFSTRGDKLIAVERIRPAPGVKTYVTHVWDAQSGEELARINSDRPTAAAALSRNDEILINGGVHPFAVDTLVRNACARMVWDFDTEEWARLSLGLEQTPSCPEQGDGNHTKGVS